VAWVYIAQTEARGGVVKLGYTEQQQPSARIPKLVAAIELHKDEAKRMERALHAVLRGYSVDGSEWYPPVLPLRDLARHWGGDIKLRGDVIGPIIIQPPVEAVEYVCEGPGLLKRWLRDNKKNGRWLSDEMCADKSMVSRWLRGKRKPPLPQADKISKLTGIPIDAWVPRPKEHA
jgi:hypothetical protein